MAGPKLFWIESDDRLDPAGERDGSFLLFPGRELEQHLKKSLRARVGDNFSFCRPEDSQLFSGSVVSVEPLSLLLLAVCNDLLTFPSVMMGLALAPIKGDGFSSILGQATMSGIHRVLPLLAERSVVDWGDRTRWQSKQSRFVSLIREKSQLAGRPDRMVVENPVSLSEFFSHSEKAVFLWFDELSEGTLGVKDLMERVLRGSSEGMERISCLWGIVGPEGGWSDSERLMARKMESEGRLFRVSLGDLTFSAEGAALSVISLLGLVLYPLMEHWNQRQSLLTD